jgi:hypothetical protein
VTTVLLTLGRLPKALEVARALHSAGARVLVAEPFERHLSGVSNAVSQSFVVTAPALDRQRYLDDLRALVRAHQVDLLVPISEEIVHVSALHGTLPASCRLLSMSQAEILAVHDKGRFVETCAAAGVSAPQSHPSDHESARELAAKFDYVLKPTSSCSGRGVRFLAAGDEVPPVAERSIVQRLLRGELVSSFSIARAGEVRLTVLYRGAVMQGTVAVCFERIDVPRPLIDGSAVSWRIPVSMVSFPLISSSMPRVRCTASSATRAPRVVSISSNRRGSPQRCSSRRPRRRRRYARVVSHSSFIPV